MLQDLLKWKYLYVYVSAYMQGCFWKTRLWRVSRLFCKQYALLCVRGQHWHSGCSTWLQLKTNSKKRHLTTWAPPEWIITLYLLFHTSLRLFVYFLCHLSFSRLLCSRFISHSDEAQGMHKAGGVGRRASLSLLIKTSHPNKCNRLSHPLILPYETMLALARINI